MDNPNIMKTIVFVIGLMISLASAAQWSTNGGDVYYNSGNVGIGNSTPSGKLMVTDNGRNYYVNRAIAGASEDAQGDNYILLHVIYTNTLLDEHYVMGKISGVRGHSQAWNRKWTVEVNTASAYSSNRGSILTYNEGTKLVTLTYGGNNYLAVQILNGSSLFSFSFTGYAYNESLQLVKDDDVTNVQAFTAFDPISIQGNLLIGKTSQSNSNYKLDVGGWVRADKIVVNTTGADFVFKPSYKLFTLNKLETYLKRYNHLPDIPSEKEMQKDGVELGDMQTKLLQKIEELTLYMIEMKKENVKQQKKIAELEKRIVGKLK